MKYAALVAALFFASCDTDPVVQRPHAELPAPPHNETGPELTEKGRVIEIAFRLGSSTTTTSQTPGYQKTIAKSAWDDPLGMHSRTVDVPSTRSSNTVTVQDQFAVVLECQHGKFVIESLGQDSVAGALWKKLKQDDRVIIRYSEVYHVTPATNERTLVKYAFVDANKE